MRCDITGGILRACKNSTGGAAMLYLYAFVEEPFTVENCTVTAINPLIQEVFPFELEGDSNTLVEDMVSDRNTGTSVNTQTLTAVIKQMNVEKTCIVNMLAYAYVGAVVVDRNGVAHALWIDDGGDISPNAQTGGAKTDLNGYTLTGVGTTGALSPKFNNQTLQEFLDLVVPVEGTYTFTGTAAVVNGTYEAGTPVTSGETVTLEVDVTELGKWVVDTNTENGYSFAAEGKFDTLGVQTITLAASGTPAAAGTDNFIAKGRVGAGEAAFDVTVT